MNLREVYRLEISKLKEAGITTHELDARLIICDTLKISHEKFILMLADSTELSPTILKKINFNINKRAQNIPIAYILGHKEFFGLDFKVDKDVLIPRPETEYLVEKSIEFIKCHSERSEESVTTRIHERSFATAQDDKIKILDLGTGSGNIIISISRHSETQTKNLEFYGSDISNKALVVAQENAKLNKIDNIKFIKSDLFENIEKIKFDTIVANLPYVPKKVESKKPALPVGRLKVESVESIFYEPNNAIFAEDNGAEIIKKFLKQAPKYLNDDGMILIELDPRNAKDILKFALTIFPDKKIRLEKDLAGFLRYLTIE